MSDLLSRFRLGNLAGLQFGGKRDLYEVLGYKRQLGFDDFWAKYQRQDIAKRVVNAPATATWRNPPDIKSEIPGFTEAWDKITSKHRIWGQISKVDRISGIGNYAVLLLGLSDVRKKEDLINEVRNKEGIELLYLQTYLQKFAEVAEFDRDPTSPRFGLPLMYKLTVRDPVASIAGVPQIGTKNAQNTQIGEQELTVHYSRVLHVAENTLDNDILGTPRLEPVFNLFDDLLKVVGGTAETFWLIANRGMQMDIDKDTELSSEDAANLSDEADEFQHQLRRIIRTRGVKIDTLGSDSPDPKNTFDMLISAVSGATGIPKRILTGSEIGQLASDQDRANWADLIRERRTIHAEPNILLPLFTTLAGVGLLPDFEPHQLEFEWSQTFQLTPLEGAQMMAQQGRAAINLSKQLSEKNPVTTREEARIMLSLPLEPEDGELPESVEFTEEEPAFEEDVVETPEEEAEDEGRPPQDN